MAAGSSAAPGVTCGGKPDLRSSGSSAQNNAMTRFVATYQQTCQGQTLNYTPSGSGAGRNEFLGGQTDFAGSDSALKDGDETTRAQARCASPAWNLPLVFGPVAIAYNVPGVTDLVLDGPTAARVFNGQVATWNDPAIAALNPGKQLPAAPIVVNFRSDESGTTENFQKYLVAASNGAYGKAAAQTFNGGVGAGARGSQGVADATKNTPNSVTYVESSFAQRGGLGMAADRQRRRRAAGAADHRVGGHGGQQRAGHRPGQRPEARPEQPLPDHDARARTRSRWRPTRSSARTTPTTRPAGAVRAFLQTALSPGRAAGPAGRGLRPAARAVQAAPDHRGQRHPVTDRRPDCPATTRRTEPRL